MTQLSTHHRNTFGISFFVKKYKAKSGLAPIYARITVKGKYLDVSLKRKVELDNWDERSGTTKGRKSEAHQLNQYLEQVRNRFYECREELEKERKLVTPEAVKNRYLGNDQQGQTLLELIKYHNTEMKSVLTWGTLKNYFTTQKYIEKFLKEKLKTSDVHLAELNYKFITRFESFVKGNRLIKNQKPCDQNGTMKHMERLRKMVSLAVKLEWLDKDPFYQYQLKFQKSRRGYLTAEELKTIEQTQFLEPRLTLIRDIFVFGCYTGLSYIEVYNLTSDQIVMGMDGNRWIAGQRQKSGELFNVPLLPQALTIMEQYQEHPRAVNEGKLLPVYTNRKINAYLKEIAHICGIEKRLTFHLARHTFATTVTLANGVPIESVSKMLGHTKISTTARRPGQIYAKVVEQKLSQDMMALKDKLSIPETVGNKKQSG